MNGEERRKQIAMCIGAEPVSAAHLAEKFGVSRQVIVQDVALLRAEGREIVATNRGYILPRARARRVFKARHSTNRGYVAGQKRRCERVFKVRHSDADTESELFAVVDEGGCVENVFVHHKVYGTLTAPMGIDSRLKTREFIQKIASGKSALLKNVTSGYHYHTVSAESEEVLDGIEAKLRALVFLVEKNPGSGN